MWRIDIHASKSTHKYVAFCKNFRKTKTQWMFSPILSHTLHGCNEYWPIPFHSFSTCHQYSKLPWWTYKAKITGVKVISTKPLCQVFTPSYIMKYVVKTVGAGQKWYQMMLYGIICSITLDPGKAWYALTLRELNSCSIISWLN